MNYSKDLRKRVVKFVIEKNNSRRKASKVFDIHYNTVKEWVKIFKETGELSPKPMRGKQPTKIKLSQLQVQETPSWFQDEHARTFGESAISKALAKLGVTRKKSFFMKTGLK